MVGIFTGAGTGFERGSGSVLGGAGLLGGSSLGRGGEQLFVNAANGNLLISRQDEFLVGRGPDVAISRTYNSLGDLTDDNGDNWRQSTERRVRGLIGTVNTVGSSVRRLSGDGSEVIYSWNGSAYVATDGDGAHDKLSHSSASNSWTWTDGSSQITEVYSADGADWRITSQSDTSGNTLTFTYDGARMTRVTAADESFVDYSWDGGRIMQIVTGYADLTVSPPIARSLSRTSYGYDGSNRLTTVTVDLSPEDLSTDDGNKYVTAYTYHGTTKLVASVSQTDGSRMDILYDSANRVKRLTQTVADGATRVTEFEYGTDYTEITDPAGQVTRLDYAPGNLATPVEAWTADNVVREPATIGGAAATRYTIATANQWSGVYEHFQVAAGETVTYGLTLQASGTITTQDLGLYGDLDQWGEAGISSARIVSGPGQLEQFGGLWRVTGLSTFEGTRIEITRTYARADRATAFFYLDNAGGHRDGTSLIAANATLLKSATAASLPQMDLNNWSTGGVDRQAVGSIHGATAYKYTVQAGSTWSGVSTGLTAAKGDSYSFSLSLQAVDGYTSQSLGLWGNSSEWGSDIGATARIVSGPGTIVRTAGGLFTVDGLSATEPTRVEIIRTYEQDEFGGAYFYVDRPGNFRAGASLIASAAHVVRRIVEPATAGQLTKVTAPPAQPGAAPQTVQFSYTAKGDLHTVTDANGKVTTYGYDGNGNATSVADRLGDVVTRTYGARNELLTETRTGSDMHWAANSHTTRYAYDGANKLRWVVTAEGHVTEHRYDAAGQRSLTIEYPDQYYDSRPKPLASCFPTRIAVMAQPMTPVTWPSE